ncbi:MAG TPA: hypothetical protein VFZ03_08500 [Dongiaceae bacterium]
MSFVTGIGEVFFKPRSPSDLARWRHDVLGEGRFGWFVDPDGLRVELWEPAPIAQE